MDNRYRIFGNVSERIVLAIAAEILNPTLLETERIEVFSNYEFENTFVLHCGTASWCLGRICGFFLDEQKIFNW
jgi:hypothetical protein